MNKESSILVLGARGLVGSAIVRELKEEGYKNILGPSRQELDLLNQSEVTNYFKENKPEFVFMAAAKVGGIQANNTFRADFIYENLTIQNNVFEAAWKYPVKKLLFLGSSCIYPKDCPQPIKEEYLLTGPLEKTNEPYSIAKIAGLKTAESFRKQYSCPFFSVMPTNLYGPNDNFDLENSHVIPGLIARMTNAKDNNEKEFKVWGTGKPRREFLYVDDMAKGCIFLMKYQGHQPDFVNLGTGEDITIKELAKMIKTKISFSGNLVFDTSKPDGTMIKRLDVSLINEMGWKAETSLSEGINLLLESFQRK